MLEEMKLIAEADRVVGFNRTVRALKNCSVQKVYLAKDADLAVRTPIIELCTVMCVDLLEVESMKMLGRACGIEVKAAVACVLK